MPKAGAGSTKAIANAIKAKGKLQKAVVRSSQLKSRPGSFEVVLSNM
jgi:hypothetical protein